MVELVQRPLMDPVTGKITYDELRTARVSSPIAGRVIGAIAHWEHRFGQAIRWRYSIVRNLERRNRRTRRRWPI